MQCEIRLYCSFAVLPLPQCPRLLPCFELVFSLGEQTVQRMRYHLKLHVKKTKQLRLCHCNCLWWKRWSSHHSMILSFYDFFSFVSKRFVDELRSHTHDSRLSYSLLFISRRRKEEKRYVKNDTNTRIHLHIM